MTEFFLRTERLGFRHWTRDDVDLGLRLWGDAEVTRFIGGPFSREWVEQRLEREIANQATIGAQYWPIFTLDDDSFAGCCGLRPENPEDNILALGFHLLPSCWGRGYATEAARGAIDYAFDMLHVSALFAGHHPDNVRSRRVLERLGFAYTHDQLYPPTGLPHPSYLLRR